MPVRLSVIVSVSFGTGVTPSGSDCSSNVPAIIAAPAETENASSSRFPLPGVPWYVSRLAWRRRLDTRPAPAAPCLAWPPATASGCPPNSWGRPQAIAARFPGGLNEVIRQDSEDSPWDDDVALAVIQAEELLTPTSTSNGWRPAGWTGNGPTAAGSGTGPPRPWNISRPIRGPRPPLEGGRQTGVWPGPFRSGSPAPETRGIWSAARTTSRSFCTPIPGAPGALWPSMWPWYGCFRDIATSSPT